MDVTHLYHIYHAHNLLPGMDRVGTINFSNNKLTTLDWDNWYPLFDQLTGMEVIDLSGKACDDSTLLFFGVIKASRETSFDSLSREALTNYRGALHFSSFWPITKAKNTKQTSGNNMIHVNFNVLSLFV